MSTLGPLAQVLGWAFIPNFAAKLLLQLVYSLVPKWRPLIHDTQPRPEVLAGAYALPWSWIGSMELTACPAANARALRHHKLAHGAVVVGYLAYSLSSAYQSLIFDANHYRLLGGLPVQPYGMTEEWDRGLKVRWRQLVKVAHPDKVGSPGEAAFVEMRTAYETLSDQLKKDAYDRFGPSVIVYCANKCASQRDYMMAGLLSSVGFYIVVAGTLFLFSTTQQGGNSYWRTLLLAGLAAAEVGIVTRPRNMVTILGAMAGLAPWQIVVFLHHLYIAAAMAINHLIPLWTSALPLTEQVVQAIEACVTRIRQLAFETDAEAFVLSRSDLQPLLDPSDSSRAAKANEVTLNRISQSMLNALVDSTIRSDLGRAHISHSQRLPDHLVTPKEEEKIETELEEEVAQTDSSGEEPERTKDAKLTSEEATNGTDWELDSKRSDIRQIKKEEIENLFNGVP